MKARASALLALTPFSLAVVLAGSSGSVACTHPAIETAPIIVGVSDVGDAGAIPPPPPSRSDTDSTTCTARLRAGDIDPSSPACNIDSFINKTDGVLRYPCKGDGDVDARFGSSRFHGTLASTNITLDREEPYDWKDGCEWVDHEHIEGAFARPHAGAGSAPPALSLDWSYSEQITQRNGHCYQPCAASAPIHVVFED